jgi:glycosyltransferase involved in cell wall biosynthesis
MGYRKRIKKQLCKTRYFSFPFKTKDIVIFDDIMPSPLSPWRSYEFEMISNFFSVKVITDLKNFKKYSNGYSYSESLDVLSINYPNLSKSINKISNLNIINSKIIYFIFYTNAIKFYKVAIRNKINFAFTLYPGGGFKLNSPESEKTLRIIFESENFKGVIVNQFHVKEYLISKKLCSSEKIKLIPGVPLNLRQKTFEFDTQKYSKNLKLLFFGNKYSIHGEDKGFDVFIKIAKYIVDFIPSVTFHVIGGFEKKDLNDRDLEKSFIFHGKLIEKTYSKILSHTHIVISPNRPFVLSDGAFDGFPLATCVEASLYGNMIMATDYFNEASKIGIEDGEDFLKIDTNHENISKQIINLNNNRKEIKKISNSGRFKMLKLYSYENQITPRLEFFKNCI